MLHTYMYVAVTIRTQQLTCFAPSLQFLAATPLNVKIPY